MQHHILWSVVMALVMCVFGVAPAFGEIVFCDGTFNEADWSSVASVYHGTGGSFTASQATSGGNPGSYYGYTLTVNTAPSYSESMIGVSFICNGSTYDPAVQGAISSVAYSEDTFVTAMGAGLAVLQNGIYYIGGYRIDGNDVPWGHHAFASLAAWDFWTWDDRSLHPDFSSTGSPMKFGFFRAISADAGTGGWTAWGGTDNWQVTITPVPEPASLSLLVLGGLAILRRR